MPRARSLESYSSANRSQIGICHLCCCCAGWKFFQQNKTIIRLLAEKIWWLGYLACWQYLLVVWTSCRRNFEIQSRCVRRPCQCHCVLNKTTFCQFWKVLQIFEGFKMEIPGAIRGMFGVQMAPLEVPRVPSPSFYTLLFSSSLYFAPPSTLYMLCFSLFKLCTSPALLKC